MYDAIIWREPMSLCRVSNFDSVDEYTKDVKPAGARWGRCAYCNKVVSVDHRDKTQGHRDMYDFICIGLGSLCKVVLFDCNVCGLRDTRYDPNTLRVEPHNMLYTDVSCIAGELRVNRDRDTLCVIGFIDDKTF